MDDWAPLLGPLGLVIGAAVTGWFALRERRVEHSRPDWPAYAERLESRVDQQDRKIDELFVLVGRLRAELDSEKRLSAIVLRYVRVVIAWALELLPPGTQVPAPPSEISAEIRDLTGGGDET